MRCCHLKQIIYRFFSNLHDRVKNYAWYVEKWKKIQIIEYEFNLRFSLEPKVYFRFAISIEEGLFAAFREYFASFLNHEQKIWQNFDYLC